MHRRRHPAAFAALRSALPLAALLALAGCARSGPEPADSGPDAATAELLAQPGSFPAPGATAPDTVAKPAPVDSAPPPLDPSLFSEWTDFDAACARSRSIGVPVMLAFRADWAEPCAALQHEVFDHAARGVVVKSLVVPVAVTDRAREDGQNRPEVQRLLDRFHVETFPTIVVYAPATGRLARRDEYGDPDAFLGWLEHAVRKVSAP